MKKILITGKNGFVGSHLYKALSTSRYEIRNIPRSLMDLQNPTQIKSILESYQPDIIIHLAGVSSPSKTIDAAKMIDINISGTTRLLQYMPKNCKFIFASSITAGGTCIDFKNEFDKAYPTSLYAITKLTCEHLINIYTKNYVNLRFCAIIGSGITHGCLLDFNQRIKEDVDNFTIMGNAPGSCKPYLHISDCINAIMQAIKTTNSGTFNITNNDSITIEEIVDTVFKYHQINKQKVWLGQNFAGDNPYLNYSNKLAKDKLEWSPTMNSKEAIIKTIEEINE
jgi:nucleoside-diphosphate-sugar epimerase